MFSPVILFLIIHALSLLTNPYRGTFFQKILIMTPPIIIGALFVGYTSLYSDYMNGSQTSISGGISLAEILSGIAVYVLFASALLSTYRIDWKTIGTAFILGIWLMGIGNIFNLGFSDKTQALLEKRNSYQTHVRNYIIFSFNNLRNAKVCTKDPSLPWYARQQPIIRYELFEPTVYGNIVTLIQLLNQSGCQYLLQTEGSIDVKGILEPVFSDGSIALLRINADSNLEIAGKTMITDFSIQKTAQWVRLSANNIDGTFQIDNGVLLMTYNNDVTKRDIFAYVLQLEQPIDNVMFVKMRVKISSGTNLTVDIVKDNQLITPRFLNYYPGSGEWEEIVIPIDGRLETVTVGISEPNAERTTPIYRIEIDWIEAIVKP